MRGNIYLGSWFVKTKITLMSNTIAKKHTWKRTKIKFMCVVRSQKWVTQTTKSYEKAIIWRFMIEFLIGRLIR